MSRVVVTGIGSVTPLGLSAEETFAALLDGRSGVGRASIDLGEEYDSRIAGEVKSVDASAFLGGIEAKRHARFTQLAAMAAFAAIRDAGLRESKYAPERVACIIGVGLGGLEVLELGANALRDRGPQRVPPFAIPAMIPNMAAGAIATAAGARGPSYAICSACASGAHAIGEGLGLLRRGVVDAVICGGAEAVVTRLALACFARMRALSVRNDDPARASRPFDRARDGFVLAEGAGILVLERESDARRRGATIRAELAGAAATSDAHHPTQPSGRGAVDSMRFALADASIAPDEVDYVNAHGTATRQNDVMEAAAIREVFGAHVETLPVSSTKGAMGHLIGAAGAVEAIVCVQAIERGLIPGTLNLDSPDPDCALPCLPTTAREVPVRVALSNSLGFGGQNGTLVFRAPRAAE